MRASSIKPESFDDRGRGSFPHSSQIEFGQNIELELGCSLLSLVQEVTPIENSVSFSNHCGLSLKTGHYVSLTLGDGERERESEREKRERNHCHRRISFLSLSARELRV